MSNRMKTKRLEEINISEYTVTELLSVAAELLEGMNAEREYSDELRELRGDWLAQRIHYEDELAELREQVNAVKKCQTYEADDFFYYMQVYKADDIRDALEREDGLPNI